MGSFGEGMAYPLQSVSAKTNDVEAAGGRPAREVPTGESGKKIACGAQQALLFSAVYTGGGTTVALRAAIPHFHEHQYRSVTCHEIDFAGATRQIPFENDQTLPLKPEGGAIFRQTPEALGG